MVSMATISLFIPVNYTRQSSCTEQALSVLSDYFYLGGARATVIRGDEVQLENGKVSCTEIALKISSYVLLFPITLSLLIVNVALRSQHHFILITRPSLETAKAVSRIIHQPNPKSEEQKNVAATKIQSFWRGHLAKVKVEKAKRHFLSYALLEQAKLCIDTLSQGEPLPRAPAGKTPVYLPTELPIILKRCGSPANQERFDQMKQAREICEQGGYKNLVIPRARVFRNFIVESRLPITVHGAKEQIGLYVENRERFTGAVQEFTGFLCQSSLLDITGGNRDPYGSLSKTPIGRYDNVALYLEGNQGKIGLIDLEGFSPERSKSQEYWCFFPCRDAVHLFPYHLDEIMSVAKNFDSNIETHRGALEKARNEALKRFKLAYENHLEFVVNKGVTFENPIAFEKLNVSRIEELKGVVEAALRKEHEGFLFTGCLGENSDATLKLFNEQAFPQILDAIYNFINDRLESSMKFRKNKGAISSNLELLSLRTLTFTTYNNLYYRRCVGAVADLIGVLTFGKTSFDATNFSEELLHVIFKELERGGDISYYNPDFGDTTCIFC